MKKTILLMMVVVMAFTLMGGIALAGGWTTISYTLSHDPNDTTAPAGAVWNANEATPEASPHGYFSSSSNKCRVCHAVHGANTDSWRLLRNTSAATECDACHGPGGLTQIRPYDVHTWDASIAGEHTINAAQPQPIPDSTPNASIGDATQGLVCNSCHSVHGANTLIGYGAVSNWDTKILRRDANKDGNILAAGSLGTADASIGASANAKKTGFCADCHNKNPNWDSADAANGMRDNPTSHVQGASAEGSVTIDGTTQTVAGWAGASQNTTAGCRGCHSASDLGNNVVTNPGDSAFPHRSKGSKLLADTYNGDLVGSATDPNRVLERMDTLCGTCHTNTGLFGAPTTPTAGVGVTF